MLEAVPSAPELRDGAPLMLLVGTAEIGVRLRLLDRDVLAAGERCFAQLHGAAPIAIPARERFILRRPSPAQTVAGGRILDPNASRLRRLRPETPPSAELGRLAAMADAEPGGILRMLVDRAGMEGVGLARASQWAGVSKARATMLLAAAPVAILGSTAAVTRSGLDEVVRALPRALERRPDGVARERLASLLPGVGEAVFDAALAILGQRGVLRSGGGTVQLRRPDQERDAARDEAAAAGKLAELLRRAGLSPPDLGALAPDKQSQRLVNRLIREGLAVRTVDVVQKRDVVFHRDAVETAKARLRPHLSRPPGLLVGEAGAVLGISRKFSVPLLEHLDAIRFTRRIRDRRVIAAPASAEAPPG